MLSTTGDGVQYIADSIMYGTLQAMALLSGPDGLQTAVDVRVYNLLYGRA